MEKITSQASSKRFVEPGRAVYPPAQSRIVYDVIDTHISVLRFFPGAESKRPKPQPHINNLNSRDEFVWNEQPCPPTGIECIKATFKPGWPNEVHWLANNLKLDQQPELKWVSFVPSLPQCRDAKSENAMTFKGISYIKSFGHPSTPDINGRKYINLKSIACRIIQYF